MKPKSISGLIFTTADMGKTLQFYEGLGFRIDKNDGQVATVYLNWFFMEFHLDTSLSASDMSAATTEAGTAAGTTPPAAHSGPTVMVSVDAQAFYTAAVAAGYTPEDELQPTVNGRREFHLRDPNGYLLAFFDKK